MSMAREDLAERIRAALPASLRTTEKKMFGGIAFMLNGNMLICPLKDGALMVRVGKEALADALERPGAGPMEMRGRPVSGFVLVSGDAIEDDDDLAFWIGMAHSFVKTLPAK